MSKYSLMFHRKDCMGCHACEVACKQENRAADGVKLIAVLEKGPEMVAGKLNFVFHVNLCRHCDEPPCVDACPTGVFSQRQGGGVVVRKKHCIRCGECVAACPVDAVSQDVHGEVYVCLHCGRCVEFCPHNCLEFGELDQLRRSLHDD